MAEIREIARKHALKNASEFGRASVNAVVGKVIAEAPEAKGNMAEAAKLVAEAVEEVNALSKEAVAMELGKHEFKPKEEKEEGPSIKLQYAEKGKVVTRMAVGPNGYAHIGHAKAAWLDCEAARIYEGKFLLRFDDTNPEVEKAEYVQAWLGDLAWLGIVFDKELYASDRMRAYYSYAKRLVSQGDAYMCTCSKETIAKGRSKGAECACRGKSVQENLELWHRALVRDFREGDAVLRLKGDMKSLNTTLRDPTLARIVEAPHYRQGDRYAVWPTYDFEVVIADAVDDVTHVLRSKEYELRDEQYLLIAEKLGLRKPHIYDFSRINFKGMLLGKRYLRPLVEQKKVMGWDDPRMPTLIGLRRRGILPEAIKKFVMSFGLSKVESEPSIGALLTENRKLLDPIAPRYFFVPSPFKVVVRNATGKVARIPFHPEKDLGFREIKTSNEFFIPAQDAKALDKGVVFRLIDLYNVKVVKKTKESLECEFAGEELKADTKKLQWLPNTQGAFAECEVLVPGELFVNEKFNSKSLGVEKGLVEAAARDLEEGAMVQFLRYGFARLDSNREMRFVKSC